MYWRDHAPPHFHAKYQSEEITVDIETGKVTGKMSPRALAMIEEWRRGHKDELLLNWTRAITKQPLSEVAPLE